MLKYDFIGNLYLLFSIFIFLFAGILILGVRTELISPGINIITPDFFNTLVTTHGLIMILGVIVPSIFGLSYWIVPRIFKKKGMIFNKISFFNFFLYLFSIILLIITFFLPYTENISCGWTLYTPLSIQLGYNIDFLLFSIILLSLSTFINSINFLISILRNTKFNLKKISIFLLCLLISCYLIIIIVPVLIGLIIMLFLDRNFNTSFFNPILGGDTLMFQHIFWFFGHPEVYIIILPSFGLISQTISYFSNKIIFGYNSMIYAILSISILSLMVWGHHMFCSGMSFLGKLFFMYCTILISIPTGIKIFNWLFTLWRGKINFNTPMLFAIGFLFFFIIGGFSGLILSLVPINIYLHGTYFVVAHFHYILVSSVLFAIYSSFYYWSPLILNKKYNNFRSKLHFWFSFFSLNFTFFPMHFLGLSNMPRRYNDYPIKYQYYNKLITFSSIWFGFTQLYFIYFILFPLIF